MSIDNLIDELVFLKKEVWQGRGKLWKSSRYSPFLKTDTPDTNIFISATIVYLLRQIKPKLQKEQKKKVNKLIASLATEYELYRNKDGRLSYNFWKTMPSEHFPNTYFLRRWDYLRLPDDTDDTALVALAADFSKEKCEKLLGVLSSFANLQKRTIKRTKKEYQHYGAFSTFLGINTPLEFDLCVQANVLSLFYKQQIELNQQAKETIAYMKRAISDALILEDPFLASPNYYRSSIIFYHIARLIYFYNCSDFDEQRDELKNQIRSILLKDEYDAFFQQFSLLLLSEKAHFVDFDVDKKYPFFIAGMLSGFENRLVQKLAPKPFCHIKFYSKALNLALKLQFKLLQESD